MQHPELTDILHRTKQFLASLYQEQLQGVILYGSQARQDAQPDSDIDLLVILNTLTSPYEEIDRTGDFIADLCLEFDVVISRHFISAERYKTVKTPFLANVKREGISV